MKKLFRSNRLRVESDSLCSLTNSDCSEPEETKMNSSTSEQADENSKNTLQEKQDRLLRSQGIFQEVQKQGLEPLLEGLRSSDEELCLASVSVCKHIITFKGYTSSNVLDVKNVLPHNRSLFRTSSGFVAMADLMKKHLHALHADGSKPILRACLQFFSTISCSDTEKTKYTTMRHIMELMQPMISSLLRLSTSSDTIVAYHSAVVIQCLLLHANGKIHDTIQRSALRTGCFLKHILIAVNGPADLSDDTLPPLSGTCASRLQHESRMLVGLLTDGHPDASRTLDGIIPMALIRKFLNVPHKFTYHFAFVDMVGQFINPNKAWFESSAYCKYENDKLTRENWMAVFGAMNETFSERDFFWNSFTRQQLVSSLQSEVLEFQQQQSVKATAEWLWDGFEVRYSILDAELKCGRYFVRLLLRDLEQEVSLDKLKLEVPGLVTCAYNRAVLEDSVTRKLGCLRLISMLFRRFPQELSVLDNLPYFVWLLDPQHTHPLWRDHILNFFATLLTNQKNARVFIESGGLSHLNWYISDIHRKPKCAIVRNKSAPQSVISANGSVCSNPSSSRNSPLQIGRSSSFASQIDFSKSFSSHSPSLTPALIDDNSIDFDEIKEIKEENILEQTDSPMSRVAVCQSSIVLVRLLCQRLPRLRKSISRHQILQSLVQALLCDEEIIVTDVTASIAYLMEDNSHAVPRLACTGLFLYLMYCTQRSCTLETAKLIHYYHGQQNNEFVKTGESALAFMLPTPLIRVLEDEGPEKFMECLNDGAVERPDLIWNNSVRQILYSHLNKLVEAIRKSLSDDPQSCIPYCHYDPIVYECLSEELCISGIYVRLFNEQVEFPLKDPADFMDELVGAMKHCTQLSKSDLKELLNAQIIMARRFPHLLSAREYPTFEILLSLLVGDVISTEDREVMNTAADLTYFLLTLKTETDNRSRCVNSCGVPEMAKAILQLFATDFDKEEIRAIMLKFLSILNMVCYKNPPALSILIDQDELFTELCRMIDMSFVVRYPDVALSAVQSITTFVASASLLKKFVENGAVLFALNIVMFCDIQTEQVSRVISAAAKCLSSMACDNPEFSLEEHAGGIDSPEAQYEFHKHLRHILRSLLTPGLYTYCVRDPSGLIAASRNSSENPLLIWNDETRSELEHYFDAQFPEIRKTGVWQASKQKKFFFTYTTLRHDVPLGAGEIVVDDIYLRLYIQDFGNLAVHDSSDERGRFLVKLLKSIENCSKTVEKMVDEKHKEVAFDFLIVVGKSITRLLSEYPFLLQEYDGEMKYLSIALVSPVPDIEQAIITVMRCLADSPKCMEFLTPSILPLHALLNADRSRANGKPATETILDMLSLLCETREEVVPSLLDSGVIASAMWIFGSVDRYTREQRLKAAHLLGVLANDRLSGIETRGVCKLLLTREFDSRIVGAVRDPEMLVEFFDQDHDTPVIYWDDGCRRDLLFFLESELKSIREHQAVLLKGTAQNEVIDPFGWITQDIPDRFIRATLTMQLCIDEIYIDAFNANPFYPVNTQSFWEKLFEGLRREFEFYCHVRDRNIERCKQSGEQFDPQSSPVDDSGEISHAVGNLTALWESLRNLLANQPALQAECVSNLSYFFSYFHPLVDKSLQLTVLNITKSFSTNSLCAKNVVQTGLMKDLLPLLVTLENDTPNLLVVLDLLINILQRNSGAVEQIRLLGGLVIVLHLLVNPENSTEIRFKASALISAMAQDRDFGPETISYVTKFVTSSFRTKFAARPELLIEFVDSAHESRKDKRFWNHDKRKELCDLLAPEGKILVPSMMQWDRKSELWSLSKLDCIWENFVGESNESKENFRSQPLASRDLPPINRPIPTKQNTKSAIPQPLRGKSDESIQPDENFEPDEPVEKCDT